MAETAFGQRLERAVRERAALIGARAAVKMEVELRRNWTPHNKTRQTLDAISVRLESLTESTITYVAKAETPQARYVNDGTAPHVITPKANPGATSERKQPFRGRNEPLLVFFWARVGRKVKFRWVDHPGYRGSGWWDYSLSQWGDFLDDSL